MDWKQVLGLMLALLLASPVAAQLPLSFPRKDPPLTSSQITSLQLKATLQAPALSAAYAAPEITPSVFVFSMNEVEGNSCKDQVLRAKSLGSASLQFVITNYWQDPKNTKLPVRYCVVNYITTNGTSVPSCVPYTAIYKNGVTVQASFYQYFQSCVQYAVGLGFKKVITFNPRLDQWQGGTWRAYLAFNPLANYGGTSYNGTMLMPLAALAKIFMPQVQLVRLALGGEHAYTYTAFPDSYVSILAALKAYAPGMQMGAHLTPNAPCPNDCRNLTTARKASVQRFFAQSDFFAFSQYPTTPEDIQPAQLEWTLWNMATIMSGMLGVDIATFSSRNQLLALEFAWGGGISDSGDKPATTGLQVAQNAWRGIFGGYTMALDPWQNYRNDDVRVATRDWQRKAYRATISWLQAGQGPTYGLGAVALWSLCSWDAIGTSEPRYRDRVVAQLVLEHNSKVLGKVAPANAFGIRTTPPPPPRPPSPPPRPSPPPAKVVLRPPPPRPPPPSPSPPPRPVPRVVVDGRSYPVCQNAAAAGPVDQWGRRWGWENNATCVILVMQAG